MFLTSKVSVIPIERRSPILAPSSLACLAGTTSVDLTSGCAHSCVYCYANGYSTYPGQGVVLVYKNALEKIKKELLRKRHKPQMVYFSPSSDLFQPISDVSELAYAVLQFLLSQGIGVAFLTKGNIPDEIMDLLLSNRDRVKAQIGIITPDDDIRQVFEPGAASIDIRLQQIKRMVAGGIAVEARLMPIIPGVTDTTDSLDRLFYAIANAGVRQAAISTLFLRSAIVHFLVVHMPDKRFANILLNLYKNSAPIAVRAEHSSVIPLPLLLREEIYRRVKKIAGQYSIDISICGCMNPDIGGDCNIGGSWSEYPAKLLQPNLFELPVR